MLKQFLNLLLIFLLHIMIKIGDLSQLELDWQRRYEEKESNQYEKSEDLIKKLAKSRDEVISESRIK